MFHFFVRSLATLLLLGSLACVHAPVAAPAVPEAPRIDLVYPAPGGSVSGPVRHFVLGNVRPAHLKVTVNGIPAQQGPGGGFVAFVPVTPGASLLRVEAREEGSAEVLLLVEAPYTVRGYAPTLQGMIDPTSLRPLDALVMEPGDLLPFYFRGAEGITGKLLLGDGLAEAVVLPSPPPDRSYLDVTWEALESRPALAAGERDQNESGPGRWYQAQLRVPPPSPERGWGWGSAAPLRFLVERAGIPVELPLPQPLTLRDPSVTTEVELFDRPRSDPDFRHTRVAMHAGPEASFFQFLANGTRARAGRRWGPMVEIKLDAQLSAWAKETHVHPLPAGTPTARSLIYAVRTRKMEDGWTRIQIGMDHPTPVQVIQDADGQDYRLIFYGAQSEIEFLRLEPTHSMVRAFSGNQLLSERFELEVKTRGPAWGYRHGWEGTDFYLDLRPPPRLRPGRLFQGLTVTVDPGHSPDHGAVGPNRLLEKDVNLAVSQRLRSKLERAGARVLMTREGELGPEGLALAPRVLTAVRSNSDLLISVHHNSLPDAVNPLDPHGAMGTSVYFYHPQSQGLALALQESLLSELKLPDRGIGLGDLALCRAPEVPSVLTEAAFLTLPAQEELLRSGEFQEREAQALFDGLEKFLRQALRDQEAAERR